MARMQSLLAVVGLSVLALGTGCVSQERYVAKSMQADASRTQLDAAQSQVTSERSKAEVLQASLDKARQNQDSQNALIVNQASQITELTRQLEELNGRYNLAMANIGKAGSTPLPPQLLSELSAFAQQNPDVVEFDQQKGLVKFKSDVTFSVGSDIVKPEAKTVIDRLAGILNGPTASQYELCVVGHTDNDQVSNPVTKKAGHLDNWYLSAHRAIAVSKELRSQNVAASRIQVAGVADTKPLVPNDSPVNKAKNRRVEVFILPTTVQSGTPAPAAPVAHTPAAKPAAKPGMNKDVVTPTAPTVQIDRGPALNK